MKDRPQMYRRRMNIIPHKGGVWRVEKFIKKGFKHELKNPPTQNITRGLFTSGVTENKLDSIPNELWEDYLPGISKIKYGLLDITDITYGYVIKAKYGVEGPKSWDRDNSRFYGRQFTTEGFIFYVKEEVFEKAKEIALKKKYVEFESLKESVGNEETYEYLRQVALHTLKHALLSKLPYFIGLEPNKIGGSYDYIPVKKSEHSKGANNVIYIFDTEVGGTGACETLKKDPSLFIRWMDSAKRAIKNCPSGYCPKGYCKRCIYTENCGEVNRNLNRFLASPTFFNDSERSWVYDE